MADYLRFYRQVVISFCRMAFYKSIAGTHEGVAVMGTVLTGLSELALVGGALQLTIGNSEGFARKITPWAILAILILAISYCVYQVATTKSWLATPIELGFSQTSCRKELPAGIEYQFSATNKSNKTIDGVFAIIEKIDCINSDKHKAKTNRLCNKHLLLDGYENAKSAKAFPNVPLHVILVSKKEKDDEIHIRHSVTDKPDLGKLPLGDYKMYVRVQGDDIGPSRVSFLISCKDGKLSVSVVEPTTEIKSL